MIAGWEEGFTGQCAGERVTMVVPPSLGYGNQASDKVTVVMLMLLAMMVMLTMMMVVTIMMVATMTMMLMMTTMSRFPPTLLSTSSPPWMGLSG